MLSGPCPGVALLLLWYLLDGSEEICPSVCLCTADTVSCASIGLSRLPRSLPSSPLSLDLSYNHLTWLGPGVFTNMPRLETLRMAHNQLTALGQGVFNNTSSLRHLDLSSNKLRVVEQHYFQGLWRLEELVLFNNRITRVEGGTLNSLSSLKKAYFSLNQITDFPFFSIREYSHPFLTMLDLSSNRMASLPWEDVKALPGLVQRGLFLHNNSLLCDCSMYSVFWHWQMRGYDSLKDFMDEHTCTIYGDARAAIRFLRHNRFFQNCTTGKTVLMPITVLLSNVVILEGERVRLDCQTSLSIKRTLFTWLSPSHGYINQTGIYDGLTRLFANGTLEISAARVNDSGLYVCTAVDFKRMLNATREVNVTVVRPTTDSFNTGYTTLLGCAITLVLILIYLYLTPCQCGCCKQPGPSIPGSIYNPSTLTSISPTISHGDQAKVINRHVAFLEPLMNEQNGALTTDDDQQPIQWDWENSVINEINFSGTIIKM